LDTNFVDAMDSGVLFRDVEQFLTQTWKLVDQFLLTEIRWSHAGGYTDHVVFADFQSFSDYVRTCPELTNIHAFPQVRPTAYGTPHSIGELVALVSSRNRPGGCHDSLLAEVYDPSGNYAPWLDRPGTPYCHQWSSDCETDLAGNEWLSNEVQLLGRPVAFYQTVPHWTTGGFFTEVFIGNVRGAC